MSPIEAARKLVVAVENKRRDADLSLRTKSRVMLIIGSLLFWIILKKKALGE
jgi:hypothetical protein